MYRDIGGNPPFPVTQAWIAAAFTRPDLRTPGMVAELAYSDALIDELEQSDIIIAGVPMYNFSVPSSMKAYIDMIVRVGRTFGFDRSRNENPYWPMLTGKRLVVLSSRGDYGYDPGNRLAHLNFVEPYLQTVFGFIGVTEFDSFAVEYDEFSDHRVRQSLDTAERAIERLVDSLTSVVAVNSDSG